MHGWWWRFTIIRKLEISFDNILLPITICCMHASMPPKQTSRRLRGYPPESQERVEVGSADEEASPPWGASSPPGFARVDYGHLTVWKSHNLQGSWSGSCKIIILHNFLNQSNLLHTYVAHISIQQSVCSTLTLLVNHGLVAAFSGKKKLFIVYSYVTLQQNKFTQALYRREFMHNVGIFMFMKVFAKGYVKVHAVLTQFKRATHSS